MSQEQKTQESNSPSTKPATSLPNSERPESFSDRVYYGVPFDELLAMDYKSMSPEDQAAYLRGLHSARANPGHKKVEKSTGVKNKGKGSDKSTLLGGLI